MTGDTEARLEMTEDPATFFHGHPERQCGEHRTVGVHRAWCYDCREWCYPASPCTGCGYNRAGREANSESDTLRKAARIVMREWANPSSLVDQMLAVLRTTKEGE